MTICPIAVVAGCAKCPVFKICPVKGVIGDYKPPAADAKEGTTRKSAPAKKKP